MRSIIWIELKKILYGKVVWIGLLLLVAAQIGTAILLQKDVREEEKEVTLSVEEVDAMNQKAVSDIESQIQEEKTEAGKQALSIEQRAYQIALENHVNLESDTYQADAIYLLITLETEVGYSGENGYSDSEKEELKEIYGEVKKSIEQKDYSHYIKAYKRYYIVTGTMTVGDKEIESDILSYKEQFSVNGEKNEQLENLLGKYRFIRKSINERKNYLDIEVYGSYIDTPLYQKLREATSVIEYRMNKGYIDISSDYTTSPSAQIGQIAGCGMVIMLILVLLLTCDSFGYDYTYETFRNLINIKNSRKRVFISKLCAMYIIVFIFFLISFFSGCLIWKLLFHGQYATPYVSVFNGKIVEINIFLIVFVRQLFRLIEFFAYILLGVVIIVFSRSTALAVSVSLTYYFGGKLIVELLSKMNCGIWKEALSFRYLDLSDYLLKYLTLDDDIISGSIYQNLNSEFSWFRIVCILVVYVCLFLLAYDKFAEQEF